MAGLTEFRSFLLILAGVFLTLRAVHVVVPMVYAPADPRPFHATDSQSAAERAGFEPWLPFFLPERLGSPPVLTVWTRPRPRISIVWEGSATLQLIEERSAEPAPPGALPLPGERGDVSWRRADMLHALARRGDVRIEIVTDLSEEELSRVAATLRSVSPLPEE